MPTDFWIAASSVDVKVGGWMADGGEKSVSLLGVVRVVCADTDYRLGEPVRH